MLKANAYYMIDSLIFLENVNTFFLVWKNSSKQNKKRIFKVNNDNNLIKCLDYRKLNIAMQ